MEHGSGLYKLLVSVMSEPTLDDSRRQRPEGHVYRQLWEKADNQNMLVIQVWEKVHEEQSHEISSCLELQVFESN